MMTRLLHSLLLTLLCCLITQNSTYAKQPLKNMLTSRLAEIEIKSPLDAQAIQDAGGIFDHYRGSKAHVYLLQEDFDILRARGFNVQWLQEVREEHSPLDEYHENADIEAHFVAWAAAYPSLFTYQSIGNSVQGRPLWFAKISDNVTDDEPEIEVKYIAAMHGDELAGLENCLRLIDTLLTGYGVDPVLTGLVNDFEVWIMPLMNPDGRDAGTLGQRWNANGIDLNRDFPDRVDDSTNTTAGRQIETAHVMNFSATRTFVISANFHGGAVVANYPWDSNYSGSDVFSPTPENTLFHHISLVYSQSNNTMYNNSAFPPDGTTNGADWYQVRGGMQDWNYVWMGCKEVTMEISNTKSGPESALDSLWRENRQSMINYLLTAREGVRGFVTDAESGNPVRARVMLANIPYVTYSSALHGEYFRMLQSGVYSLTFSAPGYESQTVNGVNVVNGTPTILNIQLNPLPRPEIALLPASVEQAMPSCSVTDLELAVQNTGEITLNWNSQELGFGATNYGAGDGGPRWIDSRAPGGPAYSWVDISAIGTAVSFTLDDQNLGPYAIGFTFPFYGTNYTQFRVSANGWLSFTSTATGATSYNNTALPSNSAPENILAVWWDDLSPQRAGTSVRRWTNNIDSLVVSFQNIQSYANNGLYNFEIILTADGGITYLYGNMGTNRLNSSTIGLQNNDRTRGVTVLNNSVYISNDMAIKFCPGVAVQTIPPAGSVAPGQQQLVTLRLSSCCLPDGISLSRLRFTSDDPTRPTVDLPITIDSGNFLAPSPVIDLTIVVTETGAELRWTTAENANSYSIWSSTVWPPEIGNSVLLGTTTGTSFAVSTDLPGTEYFIVISER